MSCKVRARHCQEWWRAHDAAEKERKAQGLPAPALPPLPPLGPPLPKDGCNCCTDRGTATVGVLTVAQVAEIRGVSPATVRSWVSRGKLEPLHRNGKKLQFSAATVAALR